MKTKLKDIILYSLAIVGTMSLFISASTNSEENEVGRYQIAVTAKGGKTQLYRVDTKTGVILDINERDLEKIRKRNKNKGSYQKYRK